MRRSLQSKGIEVSAQEEGDTLLVTLEGAQPVNREAVVAFIRKGMLELDIQTLRAVQVDWRQQGSLLSEWTEEISLSGAGGTNFESMSLSELDEPMESPPSIDDMDLPDDGGLEFDDSASDALALDDMDSGENAMDEAPMDLPEDEGPAAEKKKGSTSPIILLLLLAAVLGGGWYFYREGYFDSVIAQLPEPMRQYLPPSTGVAPDGSVPVDPAAPAPVAEGTPAASPEASAAPAEGASPAPAASEVPTPPAASPAPTPVASTPPAPAATPTPSAAPQSAPAAPSPEATTAPAPPAAEPSFNVGVRSAIQASNLAQSAKTAAEWSAVAKAWQSAVDAMKKVPETDANYSVAQDRIPTYEKNLAYAKSNAQ